MDSILSEANVTSLNETIQEQSGLPVPPPPPPPFPSMNSFSEIKYKRISKRTKDVEADENKNTSEKRRNSIHNSSCLIDELQIKFRTGGLKCSTDVNNNNSVNSGFNQISTVNSALSENCIFNETKAALNESRLDKSMINENLENLKKISSQRLLSNNLEMPEWKKKLIEKKRQAKGDLW